jgi:hypothetical protein
VDGDNVHHIFLVKIASTESISILKKVIKDEKKHAFQHVNADALEIFQVSFPSNDLDAALKRF